MKMMETFKVGDWVRDVTTNEVFKNEFVEEIDGLMAIGTIKKDEPNKGCKTIYYLIDFDIELWKPKRGE